MHQNKQEIKIHQSRKHDSTYVMDGGGRIGLVVAKEIGKNRSITQPYINFPAIISIFN